MRGRAPIWYRLTELLPGVLSWATLLLAVILSWRLPAAVAVFIVLFDVYFLIRTIYLIYHLRRAFGAMRANLKTDWLAELAKSDERRATSGPYSPLATPYSLSWHSIYHLIVLPMFHEPYEVVRESFESLLRTNYPKDKFLVVLALEERAGEPARQVGEQIAAKYGNQFGKFLITVHPAGLPDEIPGKGSNEAWATRAAIHELVDPIIESSKWQVASSESPSTRYSLLATPYSYDNFLVSVFDVDTQVPGGYFGRLTHAFLTAPDPMRAIYQPIPLFVNNIYDAPSLARVISFSSTFWQMMQQARPERLTSFSSQSIPLRVLINVGYWERDVVAEDSRIFWQCLLHYDGQFRVIPLLYPVSMDVNAAPNFWQTLRNLYKQQRRWAWGVEDVPYLLHGFTRNPRIPLRTKLHWALHNIEGFYAWATYSVLIFLLGWLPVLLGGRAFNDTLLSYNLPKVTQLIMSVTMIGIVTSMVLSLLLLPPRPKWFRVRYYLYYVVEWFLTPVVLILFGSVPAIEAQTRLMLGGRFRLGFWVTPKSRVSSE
ncbi:MAG: glycosyltransferase family 2 protein [Candidatus Liptonbacteria bacterium]|nr:glycosyltransferase family 2 protein [Candidatus Liptonbacteria bacterium]